MKMKVKITQLCPTLYDPMGYSPWNSPGQNTGVGCHFLSPRDLPDPGIEPGSPTLQGKADTLPSEPPGKPYVTKLRLAGYVAIVNVVFHFRILNLY